MKLLTKKIERALKPLNHYDNKPLATIPVPLKIFTPDSNWTWYAWEYDSETRTCSGLVSRLEAEFGYFSLAELEDIRGPLGLPVERDQHFKNKTVKDLAEKYGLFWVLNR